MARTPIPNDVAKRVREASHHRCGYCLSPQHLVMSRLEIEHIIPLARGGSHDETNLWLACPLCNPHKSNKIRGIDPTTDQPVPLSLHYT
jgi:5-methylcytosine-specific restriction endonuclease McrA